MPATQASGAVAHCRQTNLQQLTALDLSENATQLSTQEDEIVVLVYSTGSKSSLLWQSEVFSFSEKNSSITLYQTIAWPPEQAELALVLIELDNDSLSSTVSTTIQDALSEQPLDLLALDNDIGDDDLLGIQYLSCPFKSSEHLLTFKGLQLFDRYQYTLQLDNQ